MPKQLTITQRLRKAEKKIKQLEESLKEGDQIEVQLIAEYLVYTFSKIENLSKMGIAKADPDPFDKVEQDVRKAFKEGLK